MSLRLFDALFRRVIIFHLLAEGNFSFSLQKNCIDRSSIGCKVTNSINTTTPITVTTILDINVTNVVVTIRIKRDDKSDHD